MPQQSFEETKMIQSILAGEPHKSLASPSTLEIMIRKALKQAVAEGETEAAQDLTDILRDLPTQ
jgi:hypothetical protein